jgi:hypothetical protein
MDLWVVKDAIRRSRMRDVSGPSAVRGARLRGRFGLARECRAKEAVGSEPEMLLAGLAKPYRMFGIEKVQGIQPHRGVTTL